MASCCMPGRSSMALFTRTAKLDPGVHGARCAWAMVVHHAVGISRQRNSGYRPSRVNIMAQGFSTPDPSLRGCSTTTHYTHHQVSLMVSYNTTLVPFLGLRIGPACEAGLSAGMQRERVPPGIRKKESRSPRRIVNLPTTWQLWHRRTGVVVVIISCMDEQHAFQSNRYTAILQFKRLD